MDIEHFFLEMFYRQLCHQLNMTKGVGVSGGGHWNTGYIF